MLWVNLLSFDWRTTGNHIGIASSLQFSSIVEYRYWDYENKCLDLDGMLEDLRVSIRRTPPAVTDLVDL